MNPISFARNYWRVIVLVIMLGLSAYMLFAPAGTDQVASGNATGPVAVQGTDGVNLKYGLELAGGTRVRAPLDGRSATNARIDTAQQREIEEELAEFYGVDRFTVQITQTGDGGERGVVSIEVLADIPEDRFREGLESINAIDEDTQVQSQLTEDTYDEAEETMRARVVQSGLSGGSVRQAIGADGTRYIIVAVPAADQETVLDLVEKQGVIETVITYPVDGDNGTYQYERKTILTQSGMSRVGQTSTEGRGYGIPVTLTDQAAERYVEDLGEARFLDDIGIENCDVASRGGAGAQARGFCLLTYQDGEMIHGGGIAEGLAQQMQSGAFLQDPTVVLSTGSRAEAQQIQVNLQAGALPAPVAVDKGSVVYLSPSQANEFKVNSLIIGVITVIAVGLTVAYRYRETNVVIPMTLTALSEVVLLLGFIAWINLPLDLSHIAGLIAVVGTGVDDLIIITDEILVSKGVKSRRVFNSRFRKAFWVIGVAAATTILAMTPLAFLSLGDLQGFAIVTIVGVLLGVLVSRPAYGDILKWIVDRRNHD